MSSVSTFGTFATARLGIYASQKALDVVGNNIANINTVGYTRQALNQKSLNVGGADKYSSGLDIRIGTGALVTDVIQLRDPYLDIRYRNELSSESAMKAKLNGLNQISAYLDEVGKGEDEEGVLEAQFNKLISQMEQLSSAQGVGKDTHDTLVRSAATALTAMIRDYAGRLETLKKNQMTGFQQDLKNVNSILKRIQDLNSSIRKSQIYGGDALEQQDERNNLIDELAGYIRIDVRYEQEDLGQGLKVEKLVIRLAGNDKLSLEQNNATLIDGLYATELSVHTGDDGEPDPNLLIDLAPLKDKRERVMKLPDGTESDVVRLADNTLYGGLQAERELLTEQGEYATEEQLGLSGDPLAADPDAATKRGIPFYQKALDTLANTFAHIMNEANTTEDGTMYPLFSSNGNTDKIGPPYDDGEPITAANIAVSQSWANGTVRILQSRKDPHTSTDNSNLLHMVNLLMREDHEFKPDADGDAATKDTFFTGSFQQFFTDCMGGTLADDTMTTEAMYQNYSISAEELYVDRDAVVGVDLNDEAMNMIQFQKSYSAACRLMTVIDEVLDKLINGTGRAGL